MEIPYFNSSSIFDQIESLQPNPEAFQFRKYDIGFHFSKDNILKEGYVFFLDQDKNEIQKYQICITNDFLVRYSKKDHSCAKKILYFKNPRIQKVDNANIELLIPVFGIYLQGFNGSLTMYFTTVKERDNWYNILAKIGIQYNISEYYNQTKALGKGNFAKVTVGVHRISGHLYAIKAINKIKISNKIAALISLRNEINVMRKINHENIIKLYQVFEGLRNVYLVLEYLKGGDLASYLKSKKDISEEEIKMLLSGIIDALVYVHSLNIIHRDLKLENILLINKTDIHEIKLVDFGLSTFTNYSTSEYIRCGSPGYIAPEIFANEHYGTKVDIFSVGVLFYFLLSGIHPFKGKDVQEVLSNNRECNIQFDPLYWDKISKEGKDLCMKMLKRDPSQRSSAFEIQNHPWFSTNNTKEFPSIFLDSRDKISQYYNPIDNHAKWFGEYEKIYTNTPLMNQRNQVIDGSPLFTPMITAKIQPLRKNRILKYTKHEQKVEIIKKEQKSLFAPKIDLLKTVCVNNISLLTENLKKISSCNSIEDIPEEVQSKEEIDNIKNLNPKYCILNQAINYKINQLRTIPIHSMKESNIIGSKERTKSFEKNEIKKREDSPFKMMIMSNSDIKKKEDPSKMRRNTLQPTLHIMFICKFRSFSSNYLKVKKSFFDKKEEDLFKTASLIM